MQGFLSGLKDFRSELKDFRKGFWSRRSDFWMAVLFGLLSIGTIALAYKLVAVIGVTIESAVCIGFPLGVVAFGFLAISVIYVITERRPSGLGQTELGFAWKTNTDRTKL